MLIVVSPQIRAKQLMEKCKNLLSAWVAEAIVNRLGLLSGRNEPLRSKLG